MSRKHKKVCTALNFIAHGILLKSPTTDPSTSNPLTHRDLFLLTHQPIDHLPTDPPTH